MKTNLIQVQLQTGEMVFINPANIVELSPLTGDDVSFAMLVMTNREEYIVRGEYLQWMAENELIELIAPQSSEEDDNNE